jgi:hypothetical protein
MFPLHTWLPDAHVEAPTAGSVILAGVLLKMGTYGFLKLGFPLFPDATREFTPLLMGLSVISIVVGACLALVQTDIKKIIAYSSISHLGYVMLGLISLDLLGVQGAVIQMVSHGLTAAGLFLMVGMIYERCHSRDLAAYGGLAKLLPVYSVFFMILSLASIGLPTTSGFTGEFLILLGAFSVVAVHSQGSYDVISPSARCSASLGALYCQVRAAFLFGKVKAPRHSVAWASASRRSSCCSSRRSSGWACSRPSPAESSSPQGNTRACHDRAPAGRRENRAGRDTRRNAMNAHDLVVACCPSTSCSRASSLLVQDVASSGRAMASPCRSSRWWQPPWPRHGSGTPAFRPRPSWGSSA